VHIFGAFCITISNQGGMLMGFQIKEKKETENKTIRFPVPLIERINDAIKNENISFSGFVIQACEYALSELENKKR
jgi:hypothetical protein